MRGEQLASRAEQRLVRLARLVPAPLSVLADGIGVLTLLYAGLRLVVGKSVEQAILAAYICTLSAALLVMLFVQSRRHSARLGERDRRFDELSMLYARKARVADSLELWNTAWWRLSEASSSGRLGGTNAFFEKIGEALQAVAAAYSAITGAPCRCTLKEVYAPEVGNRPADLAVRTICSSDVGPDADFINRSPDVADVDYISQNTDFRTIFARKQTHYLCNDLVAELSRGYQNSHWDEVVIRDETFDYRSTIVWPVRGRLRPGPSGDGWEVIGFLCVDSTSTDIFVAESDVPPGSAFSYTLYSAMRDYRSEGQDG